NLKSHSYVKINSVENFILSNVFDYETNIGTLILNNNVLFKDTSSPIINLIFDTNYTFHEISDLLRDTFDVTNNIANNVKEAISPIDPNYPIENESNYQVMKPSTYSIANDIINKREKFPDLTGVVYKEFNELVYTFFKRDKKFEF